MMPSTSLARQRSATSLDLRFIVVGVALLLACLGLTVAGLTPFVSQDVGDALTRNTVRLSLAWYALAACLMMRLDPRDWQATTQLGQAARWCWTWAVLCFLVHLAMAFHYYHHWSHVDAFERTRRISGVGEGLYISYLFTLLWVGDAAWWWWNPKGYASRASALGITLHGFMLLIIFNGMVVFETGFIRWAGVAMFTLLGVVWLLTRSRTVTT